MFFIPRGLPGGYLGVSWGFPGGFLGVWRGSSLGSPSKASPGSQCTLFINKKNT